jgi:hypothetical protein
VPMRWTLIKEVKNKGAELLALHVSVYMWVSLTLICLPVMKIFIVTVGKLSRYGHVVQIKNEIKLRGTRWFFIMDKRKIGAQIFAALRLASGCLAPGSRPDVATSPHAHIASHAPHPVNIQRRRGPYIYLTRGHLRPYGNTAPWHTLAAGPKSSLSIDRGIRLREAEL